jgi:hypothetical protein
VHFSAVEGSKANKYPAATLKAMTPLKHATTNKARRIPIEIFMHLPD